jgi:hypothetical protein
VDWSARNDRLASLGFAGYDEYLASSRWQRLKLAALNNAEYRCQLCDRSKKLQVHHRSYERLGSDNEARDLVVLCERCHRKFHGRPELESPRSAPVVATMRALASEHELGQARVEASRAAAKAQRQTESARRGAKKQERHRLARERDWRDERQLPRKDDNK